MFFSFAFCTFFKIFHVRLGKKSKSVSFSRVYVCVKAKLTLVRFFFHCFFLHLSLIYLPLLFSNLPFPPTFSISSCDWLSLSPLLLEAHTFYFGQILSFLKYFSDCTVYSVPPLKLDPLHFPHF